MARALLPNIMRRDESKESQSWLPPLSQRIHFKDVAANQMSLIFLQKGTFHKQQGGFCLIRRIRVICFQVSSKLNTTAESHNKWFHPIFAIIKRPYVISEFCFDVWGSTRISQVLLRGLPVKGRFSSPLLLVLGSGLSFCKVPSDNFASDAV